MIQKGIIKSVNGEIAEVEIARSSSCGESCASCGLCPGQTAVVTALNDAGAVCGDYVAVDLSGKKVLGAAALVYILPVAALILGYFAGSALFGGELPGAATGFILMAAVFVVIIIFDKRLKKRYTPRVARILPGDEQNEQF